MDKVERAVIELDGVWLNDFRRILVVSKSGKEYRCFDSVPDACWVPEACWYFVCTYDEFMETRKRLENKPTEWPEGANILVFNRMTSEWLFASFPDASFIGGEWLGNGKGAWFSGQYQAGRYFGDARQSLERRPEERRVIVCECCQGVGTIDETLGGEAFSNPEAECPDCDGAGEIEIGETSAPEPKWVPGQSLPPKGQMVDIKGDGLVYGDGESGEAIAHVENTAVVRMDWGLGCFEARVLFPAKSHRDKVIEAVAGGLGDLCPLPEVLNAIYDIGALKLPEVD